MKREQNRIYLYAAVNLKRKLRSTYCAIEAADRHEASRGLSAAAGLLVHLCAAPLSYTKCYKYLGQLISSGLSDDADIMKQTRSLYAR